MPTEDKIHIDKRLIRWVSQSSQPLTVVDDPEFQHLLSALNCNYKAPGSKPLKKLIFQNFKSKRANLIQSFKEFPRRIF